MDNLALIDDYFQGALKPEEKSRFEERLVADETFAEEVAFYLSSKKVMLEQLHEEKKARFRELYQQGQKTPAVVRSLRKTWLYVAAAVFVLLATGLTIFLMQPSAQNLADTYIEENLQTLGVTMGGREDSLQQGLSLYNKGKVPEAAVQFESLLRADTANYMAEIYAGLSYLRMGSYDKAIDLFTRLGTYSSLRSNPAKFYLALTLLKRNKDGDNVAAKRLLLEVVDQNGEGKETAEQWLKKL